jgi:FtsZ-interacting cell division protein YlmF
MIVDIEEKLGIASSVDSFAAEYPQEDVEEEDEEQQEEQQEEEEEEEEEGPNQQRPPRTQGQETRNTLMQNLLVYLGRS